VINARNLNYDEQESTIEPMTTFRVFFHQNRKIMSFAISVILVLMIGAIDGLAGTEISLSAFYLIPIFLTSYYAGAPAGVAISIASIFVYLLGDRILSIQYSRSAVPYWNAGVRLVLFTVLAYAIAKRRMAEKELAKKDKTIQIYAQLHEVDRAILATTAPDAIAEEALNRMQPLVPFEYASVTRFDEETGSTFFLATKSIDQPSFSTGQALLERADYEDLEFLKTGKVFHIEDTIGMQKTPLLTVLPFSSLRSYVIAPLISQSIFIGSVNFGSTSPSAFSSEKVEIAREVANQMALALRNSELFEKLRMANQRLQLLNQKLLQAQETEKRNLARELHDEMGQALTALKIQLETVQSSLQESVLIEKVNEGIQLVEKILKEIRNLSLDLRPSMLDDLGLFSALRWYASTRAQLGGFSLHFDCSPSSIDLSPETETVCFRVAQEALTNIVRHAGAKHVEIQLHTSNDEILLSIKDDGKGFDVQQKHAQTLAGENFGLLGMKERVSLAGGHLEIESEPNCGTEIRAHLPLNQPLELSL
jgi:signal transduction histidine kinase